MFRYIIKRVLLMIPVILGVITLVFIFQKISPDDPVDAILPAGSTSEEKEVVREQYGLNDPVIVQFGRYVWKIVTRFDLGTSYKTGQPVLQEILARFPTTALLAFCAVGLGTLIGIPLGVVSAVKQYTWVDSVILAFSVLLAAFPDFWMALMLLSLFAVKLHWVPVTGILDPKGWILPIIVVSILSMTNITRTTRSSMLEVIRQDYIRTARAKGQAEDKIVINHALRNAMIPITAMIGNRIGMNLGGALIVESVFGLPGIGKYAVDAIGSRDYPAVLGSVVFLAAVFTVVNLIVDLVYIFIDPRLRSSVSKNKPRQKVQRKEAAANG